MDVFKVYLTRDQVLGDRVYTAGTVFYTSEKEFVLTLKGEASPIYNNEGELIFYIRGNTLDYNDEAFKPYY